ncbi:MAG: response regulator transcription factor [Anaerolineae bacterium]|nr:response regulator transcription factor [Anaerolineae bacterium]
MSTSVEITAVVLADDHALVRRGMAALLQVDPRYRIVAEANDGEEALKLADQTRPDVIILDLHMPRLNGLETLRRIRHQHPAIKILILSMYDDRELVTQALRDGASGYILKHSMEDELFEALEAITHNQQYVSPRLNLTTQSTPDEDSLLTSRELEVVQLVAEGHSTTEIADLMSISPNTAGRHLANIMKKLDVHNRVELVRLAIQRNMVIMQRRPPDLHG